MENTTNDVIQANIIAFIFMLAGFIFFALYFELPLEYILGVLFTCWSVYFLIAMVVIQVGTYIGIEHGENP